VRLTATHFVRQRQIFPFWLARTRNLQYVNSASTQASLQSPFGPDDFKITSFSKRRRDSANEPLARDPFSALRNHASAMSSVSIIESSPVMAGGLKRGSLCTKSVTACGQRFRFAATWREEFFEVSCYV
jgi:hypothetical protein